MATYGDCTSIEETILERAQLMGFEDSRDSDLRCAIFVGESLRNATTNQEKELIQLRFLTQDMDEMILKQKKLCPNFKALEAQYSQPMSQLEKETSDYRQLNADFLKRIRENRSQLDDSAKDKECLLRMLQELKNYEEDSLTVEPPGHCLLCSCQVMKASPNSFSDEQCCNQICKDVTLESQLQNDLESTIASRKRIQNDLEAMSSKMDFLSKMVMEVEEEDE